MAHSRTGKSGTRSREAAKEGKCICNPSWLLVSSLLVRH